MAEKKSPVYIHSADGKVIASLDQDIDYSKITVPASAIHTSETDQTEDTLADTLRLLAEKRTEADNLLRRRQYTLQQIEKGENKIKQGVSNSYDLETINMGLTTYRGELEFIDRKLVMVNKEIEDYSSTLSRKTHYDKQRVINNIRYLVNTTNKKLGQIEREASGCQPGYTARLDRTSTEPSLEFVVTAASHLGVSTDLLINADLSQITPTEKYLIDFFYKLERDTTDNKLAWNQEKAQYLNNLGFDEHSESPHPLFCPYAEHADDEYPTLTLKFISNSFKEKTSISNDCFNLRMKNGTYFYLMNICNEEEPDKKALEVWMYQPRTGTKFICSTKEHHAIKESLSYLYKHLDLWANHPRVEANLKSVIDAFMADDLSDDAPNTDKTNSKKSGTIVCN